MTRKEYTKLSDTEKRTKIAELCGWELDPEYADAVDPIWRTRLDSAHFHQLPDYLNDLNVMHEAAAKHLSYGGEDNLDLRGSWAGYCVWLLKIAGENPGGAFEATAAQRAEAFVLTMENQ